VNQTTNIIGYARVSMDTQDLQLQLDALAEAGCARIFRDVISSRKPVREGLDAALDYLRSGDVLLIWRLDRLGRSVKELLTIADDLHTRGVSLRILTGSMAGSYSPTGEGKFFFTMMAAFAELERDVIQQRTLAGLTAARAQGRVGGRPRALSDDQVAVAKARRANGESPTAIAKALECSRATVYRVLGENAA
jgi:DNA invertase Pin-like site-specific DNA recombinase